jgi:hypothetical protein
VTTFSCQFHGLLDTQQTNHSPRNTEITLARVKGAVTFEFTIVQEWVLYVPPALTLRSSASCPENKFMGYIVWTEDGGEWSASPPPPREVPPTPIA